MPEMTDTSEKTRDSFAIDLTEIFQCENKGREVPNSDIVRTLGKQWQNHYNNLPYKHIAAFCLFVRKVFGSEYRGLILKYCHWSLGIWFNMGVSLSICINLGE